MTREQAEKQLNKFMGNQPLTFSLKQGTNEEWVAQCNEVDGIITCGTGYDLAEMERLMQDAILSAAGIPKEFSENMLKRVFSNEIVEIKTELNSSSSVTPFQSAYHLNSDYPHATLGRVQTC